MLSVHTDTQKGSHTTSFSFVLQGLAVKLLGLSFCQVCCFFVTGPLKRSKCSLLKCKLIKVNSSSLKLNHFKAEWLPRLSLLLHFSFSLLGHPHFRKTICHSCEIATICITDAGVRVQTVAVLMSQMQSEIAAQELIGPAAFFSFFLPPLLSPLLSLLDIRCHTMTDDAMKKNNTSEVKGRIALHLETLW